MASIRKIIKDTTMFGLPWQAWLLLGVVAGMVIWNSAIPQEVSSTVFNLGDCEFHDQPYNYGDYICAGAPGLDGGARVSYRCSWSRWNIESICSTSDQCVILSNGRGECVGTEDLLSTGGNPTGTAGTPI